MKRRALLLSGLGLAAASLPVAAAEPPALYQRIAAKHGLAAHAFYDAALRFSGRPARFGGPSQPWPWTVRACAGERCATAFLPDRATMTAFLATGRAAGWTLWVGPIGMPWTPDTALPLRTVTSPRVTLNEAARQWAVAPATLREQAVARAAAPVAPVFPTAQARRWTPLINAMARREGLDPALAHAVIAAESAYRPTARSPKGAVGLMQLMPATAERFGVPRAQRHDPAANLRAGLRYLKWLIATFDGDLRLVLAGYHAGEGAVQKYGNRVPPYPETQTYVRRVTNFLTQRQSGASS
jgi:hypothetical protein